MADCAAGAAQREWREWREWRRDEVWAQGRGAHTLLVIDNVVYDVTEWLAHHPGGADVLAAQAGGDASRCFHAVGHSEDARARMRRFEVGAVAAVERREVERGAAQEAPAVRAEPELAAGALWRAAVPPLLLAAAATLLYWGLF